MSAPALNWDAIISMNKVELDLIEDVDMYLFFEKEMRDGVCFISKRYRKANNKYLTSYDYNISKYYAMSKYLPTSGFNWLDRANLKFQEVAFKEVDLESPKELLELQNDYLLSPDKLEIKREMLSDYQFKIVDDYNISTGNVKK